MFADTRIFSAFAVDDLAQARKFYGDAVEKEEEEDIFPDPMSQSVAEGWRNSAAKALEHQLAALAQGISGGKD